MLLNNPYIKEYVSKENKIVYIDLNENNNIIYQIFVDATKAVIRGKYLALNAYIILEKKNY